MNEDRRPILYKGEVYSKPIEKKAGGRKKEPRLSYGEARDRAVAGIAETRAKIKALPAKDKLPNEFVFCLRLDPEFSAKSYYPSTLFDSNYVRNGVEEIGSRIWNPGRNGESSRPSGKLLFVRATEQGLANFERKLNTSEDQLHENFKYDVRKIHAIDNLDFSEQILGIPDDWKEGRLEAVLHPFSIDKNVVVEKFLQVATEAGVDRSTIRYKQYDSGVTFVSLWGNRDIVSSIAQYNALRTAHPLHLRDFSVVTRGYPIAGGPLPPASKERASVVVGVFDGGLYTGNPYTEPYCDYKELSPIASQEGLVDHGTQVTGLVLYGAINSFAHDTELPHPNLSVRNFRVLPASDPQGVDPYEVIDAIEAEVPKNKDIRVYNLSIGPDEPILDDEISRFTFACDLLAENEGVLFCAAAGNEGEATSDILKRIQAPSDMANGLGVGAYTKRDGKILKAPYSCIGPGREGNKMKPDIVAFGGCDQTPIHLIGSDASQRILSPGGTSFSTPIVSRYAAHLIGYSKGAISTLTGRGMLIHSSVSEKKNGHSNEMGHGILAESLNDIVTCEKNTYTLLYEAELLPGKFAEFKIPWIEGLNTGNVNFRWTTVICTPVDPQSPDDYTSSSVMVTLYPNASKYEYSRLNESGKVEKKRVDVIKDPGIASQLEADGWEKSPFPLGENGPVPFATEDDLRKEMKWDSVDCRTLTKRSSSVSNPMFHVHALARGSRNVAKKVKFSIVLTVEMADESVDLYSQIVSRFDALAPVELSISNELQAQVKIES